MIRRIATIVAAGVLAIPLAACDFTATGTVSCHTETNGNIVCEGTGTGVPAVPPTTDPPPGTTTPVPPPETTEPPVEPPPGPAARNVEFTSAVPSAGTVNLTWASSRTDVAAWNIARNGTDTFGHGEWSTDLPAPSRGFRMQSLLPATEYVFTLTPMTATGELPALTIRATTPGSVEPPPVTNPPDPGPGPGPGPGGPAADTAASAHGWGAPTVVDEFDRFDPTKWSVYDSVGHAGNGRRTPDAVSVANGVLTITGDPNGNTGGLSAKFDRDQYGRWEARVRSFSTGSGGHGYHPVLIIWPDAGNRVKNGEYDWLENGEPGADCAEAFMHYPGETPKVQEHFEKCGVDLSEFHNVAFEWTPNGLTGFIDGIEWFHTNAADIAAMPSGHMTIQLDGFHGSSGYNPAKFEIDSVRYYKL